MADFPAIDPAARSFTAPTFPVTIERAFAGGDVRFTHGSVGSGVGLSLQFVALTYERAKLIRDHYRSGDGSFRPFRLPQVVYKHGNLLWKYAGPPQETHRENGRIDVAVTLTSVRS